MIQSMAKILHKTFAIKKDREHLIGVKTTSMRRYLPRRIKIVPLNIPHGNGKPYYLAQNLDMDEKTFDFEEYHRLDLEFKPMWSLNLLIPVSMLRRYYEHE